MTPVCAVCLEKWAGPNAGITSFDNIGIVRWATILEMGRGEAIIVDRGEAIIVDRGEAKVGRVEDKVGMGKAMVGRGEAMVDRVEAIGRQGRGYGK